MRNIEVHREHQLGAERARDRLKVIERELTERFGAWLDWKGSTAAVIGRGVEGTVRVDDVGVTVSLRIAVLFLPLSPLIRKEIEQALDREFAG